MGGVFFGEGSTCCARRADDKYVLQADSPTTHAQRAGKTFERRGVRREESAEAQPRPGDLPQEELAGLGIIIETDQHHVDASGAPKLFIAALASGGPADLNGRVKEGDVLVSIDGVDVTNMPVEELGDHILGPQGSNVVIGVNRGAEGMFYVQLTRALTTKNLSKARFNRNPRGNCANRSLAHAFVNTSPSTLGIGAGAT